MRSAFLLAVSLSLLLQRGTVPPLPPSGNPGHQQPAKGQACVHNEKDPAHNCACHRECVQDTDGDGNALPSLHVQEDAKCRVYCFKDHCHCPIRGCD